MEHSARTANGSLLSFTRYRGQNPQEAMKDSVVRNLGVSTPSLFGEAEDRRQRVKLGGWSLLGLVTFLALVRVSVLMVGEIFGMFARVPSMPVAREGGLDDQQPQERVLSSIASEKVRDSFYGRVKSNVFPQRYPASKCSDTLALLCLGTTVHCRTSIRLTAYLLLLRRTALDGSSLSREHCSLVHTWYVLGNKNRCA